MTNATRKSNNVFKVGENSQRAQKHHRYLQKMLSVNIAKKWKMLQSCMKSHKGIKRNITYVYEYRICKGKNRKIYITNDTNKLLHTFAIFILFTL